ncbi:hypothetical protein NLG97_g2128 [Lecanicillium saksenae]|uniref:Uncharacterized protein n=1 Tax=Lecanicillium saksenae TaxID=468837 RepID=A0ACC1R202_9HYPO|nr:hypothetical protein NLG97_g2128 [Lecanicillium saksenae]
MLESVGLDAVSLRKMDSRATELLAQLPECAIECVTRHCSAPDSSCICEAPKAAINTCAYSSCPFPQALYARNVTETFCATPVRNKAIKFNVMIIILTIVALCFISVRIIFLQFFTRRRLRATDWTVIAAIPLGLATVALTIFGLTAHGLGIDIWGLQASQAVYFGRAFWIVQILYVLLITLIKLALTLFYLSIFSGRTIVILLWATVGFHLAGALSFCIGIVFQCLPIRYQWERVTIISFLRLASVRNYASTSNTTWDQWDIVWWSTIEVEVGLICTCLPAMRLLLVRLAPRIFGSSVLDAGAPLNSVTASPSQTILDEEEYLSQQTSSQPTVFNATPPLPLPGSGKRERPPA